jgi:glycogen debranching enzyme
MIVFDNQFDTGALADYVNDDHFQLAFVKPPIHGLIYKRMMNRNAFFRTKEKLAQVYGPLTKWTNHWFNYLDDDNDGIPQYNHGCDSGWDNNTVWDIGFAVEGAELSSFLVIQMDLLSEIATKLGKTNEAQEWTKRSKKLLNQLITELWNGNNFVFARSGDGAYNKESQSLIFYLPMILGDRLPTDIQKKLLNNLKNSGIVTPYGPATENPQSPFYERDGYWRGPIWAPSTYLIVEGINACGDAEYAKEVARRFCNTCKESGFRENFVAVTGEGLRDLGYTWTSSVFLVLAHDYLYEK